MSDIIFHHYPQSPVAQKVRVGFGMKSLSWQSVEIPRVPPKPLLMPLTGGYRRTPVAQVGADIYGDSQNIFRLLDEEIKEPQLVTGLSMAMASWSETVLFNLALRIVLVNAMDGAPPEFIKDRASLYFDQGWTKESMVANLPAIETQLYAGLSLLEAHAQNSGDFLFGDAPSQADANLHYLLWFINGRWDGGPAFLAPFKALLAINEKVEALGQGSATDITGEQALAIAKDATPTSPSGIFGHNPDNLAVGDQVVIRQYGQTADPDVTGTLRYLDATRVSLDLHHEAVGHVALHLPVLGYLIKKG
ncbi:MAG: glutathione S-transferase N-terminal domain-containing protein [Candidatus Puniceispirillaceae bacterium]